MMTAAEHKELSDRRRAARRTAWVLAAIAAAIFTLFIMSGVLGS